MQIIFPPSKQIKYLAMTSKNASASPFKGFQGSLCVNINLKRKNINVFVTAFVNFRKPTLAPQSSEVWRELFLSCWWWVDHSMVTKGNLMTKVSETPWHATGKHFWIFRMFEVFAYNVYEKLECFPPRPYFLSCYIYHDRRPTRGDRVWIMGHTIAMKIHENTFIPDVGVNDYY